MNLLVMAGYLGGDAEVRYAQSGTAITTFSMPVECGWGDNKVTTWVRCTLFGRKGSNEPHGLTQYLLKGKYIACSGEMKLVEFTGRDGEKRASVECIVSPGSVSLGPGGDPEPQQDYSEPQEREPAQPPGGGGGTMDDEDIPFSPYMKGSVA